MTELTPSVGAVVPIALASFDNASRRASKRVRAIEKVKASISANSPSMALSNVLKLLPASPLARIPSWQPISLTIKIAARPMEKITASGLFDKSNIIVTASQNQLGTITHRTETGIHSGRSRYDIRFVQNADMTVRRLRMRTLCQRSRNQYKEDTASLSAVLRRRRCNMLIFHGPQLNKDLEMPNLDYRQRLWSSPGEGR
ncbi:MAG: hypothetical protein WCB75_13810, partial [Pseudolabrys sp.]